MVHHGSGPFRRRIDTEAADTGATTVAAPVLMPAPFRQTTLEALTGEAAW
jgi:hypothetical protein